MEKQEATPSGAPGFLLFPSTTIMGPGPNAISPTRLASPLPRPILVDVYRQPFHPMTSGDAHDASLCETIAEALKHTACLEEPKTNQQGASSGPLSTPKNVWDTNDEGLGGRGKPGAIILLRRRTFGCCLRSFISSSTLDYAPAPHANFGYSSATRVNLRRETLHLSYRKSL